MSSGGDSPTSADRRLFPDVGGVDFGVVSIPSRRGGATSASSGSLPLIPTPRRLSTSGSDFSIFSATTMRTTTTTKGRLTTLTRRIETRLRLPRLSSIQDLESNPDSDRFSSSRLHLQRFARDERRRLSKMALVRAAKARAATLADAGKDASIAEEPDVGAIDAADEMRRLKEALTTLRRRAALAPLAPVSSERLENIRLRIPEKLTKSATAREALEKMMEEVMGEYEATMRRLAGGGEEGEELARRDNNQFSSSPSTIVFRPDPERRRRFREARRLVRRRLHVFHPLARGVADACGDAIDGRLLFNADDERIRDLASTRIKDFAEAVDDGVEKSVAELMKTWFPRIIGLFSDKTTLKSIGRKEEFFGSISRLVANRLVGVILRSLTTLRALVEVEGDGGVEDVSPRFRLEIILEEDDLISVYPPSEEFKRLVHQSAIKILHAFDQVPTIRSWLKGEEETFVSVAVSSVDEELATLSLACDRIYEDASKRSQEIARRFGPVIDGSLKKKVETVEQEASFEERLECVENLRGMLAEVGELEDEEDGGRIRLMLDDVKDGLTKRLGEFCERLGLVSKEELRRDCQRVSSENREFERKALEVSNDFAEYVQMAEYMREMDEHGLGECRERVEEILRKYLLLSESEIFSEDDAEMLAKVLKWPSEVERLREEHEAVKECNRVKLKKNLEDEMRKFESRLKNLQMKVEGFDDYLEMEMIEECGKEFRAVKATTKEAEQFLNRITHQRNLLCGGEEVYEPLKEIHELLEPLERVLTVALKFLRSRKRWMDGELVDIQVVEVEEMVEDIEGEFEKTTEYLRDLEKDRETTVKIETCERLLEELREFKRHLPVLKRLRHPLLTKDHFERLAHSTGADLSLRYGTTFRRLLDAGLLSFLDELELVVLSEEDRVARRSRVAEMRREMEDVRLKLVEDEAPTRLGSMEDVVDALRRKEEETRMMLENVDAGEELTSELKEWVEELNHFEEVVEELKRVERTHFELRSRKSEESGEGNFELRRRAKEDYLGIVKMLGKENSLPRVATLYNVRIYSLKEFFRCQRTTRS